MPVTVSNSSGTSPAFLALLQPYSPAFFMFSPQGGRYPAATLADGTYLGPPALFFGAPQTRPAAPGETIVLYGTGFGATNPPVPSNRVFTGAAPLVNPLSITIGGQPATVQFAGISGAGLCQFNVVVPDVPDGDQQVVATIGILNQTQSNVFVAVHR